MWARENKAEKNWGGITIERKLISPKELLISPFEIWDDQWFLLTAGDFASGKFNTMTVAWGSFGIMWNKPFAQVVVRPTRFTFGFMNEFDTFSLCAFPENYRDALNLLGTKSGRDGDKISESGLTPIKSQKITAPSFEEADIIIECKKIYWQDFDPGNFLDEKIHKNYPKKDYHRVYFGEILCIMARDRYKLTRF